MQNNPAGAVRILFLGDVVGETGREFIKQKLPGFVKTQGIDWVIANAENIAGGSGITRKTVDVLFDAGVHAVTSGDHIWKKKEVIELLDQYPIVRPLNYGEECPGKGYLYKEKNGLSIAVVNLIGRVFMQPVDCPFKAIRSLLPELLKKTKIIIVDIHAEATSEKLALGYFLAGKVSAVFGTHTHIPTADERIIAAHTAYLTDTGMCGAFDSILGRVKENVIERFVTNISVRFNIADKDLRIQGVLCEIEPLAGKALSLRRVELREDAEFLGPVVLNA
jgi:hypothetical protein